MKPGQWKRLHPKELMPLNGGAVEDSWEFPSTAGRLNQSIFKEINPEYSLKELTLELKLQYFGHLIWRTDSLEKTLMLGKIEAVGEEDDRGWDVWMASPIQWTWVWANSGRLWRTGKPGVLQSVGSQIVGHDWTTELNWTEHVLAIVNSLKWTTGVHVSFEIRVSPDKCPEIGLLDHMVILFLFFKVLLYCYHRGCNNLYFH